MRNVFITLYGIKFLFGLMFSGCSIGESHIGDFRPDGPNDELVDPEPEWVTVNLPSSVVNGNFSSLLGGLRVYPQVGGYFQISEDGKMVLYYVEENGVTHHINMPLKRNASAEKLAYYTNNTNEVMLLYDSVMSNLPFFDRLSKATYKKLVEKTN